MREPIMKDLMIAVVDEGASEAVLDAARSAGAWSGTALPALHIDLNNAAWFFGFPVQDKKDMVMICADREDALAIMQAVGSLPSGEDSQMALFSLPTSSVVELGGSQLMEARG